MDWAQQAADEIIEIMELRGPFVAGYAAAIEKRLREAHARGRREGMEEAAGIAESFLYDMNVGPGHIAEFIHAAIEKEGQ